MKYLDPWVPCKVDITVTLVTCGQAAGEKATLGLLPTFPPARPRGHRIALRYLHISVPGRGLTYITHQDIAIILTGKPRLREVKRRAQGHTVSSFQCPDLARPGQTLFFLLRSAASLLTRQTLPEP